MSGSSFYQVTPNIVGFYLQITGSYPANKTTNVATLSFTGKSILLPSYCAGRTGGTTDTNYLGDGLISSNGNVYVMNLSGTARNSITVTFAGTIFIG